MYEILLIEDDALFHQQLQILFEPHLFKIHWYKTGKDGVAAFAKEPNKFDCVICDFDLPDTKGNLIAMDINEIHGDMPIVFSTAHQDQKVLLALLSSGVAKGFFLKGNHPDELKSHVERAAEKFKSSQKVIKIEVARASSEYGLVGSSRLLSEVRKKITRYKNIPSNVLILGESGTGKELVARGLKKNEQAFFAINCAKYSADDALLESELFGYLKGAFTGAQQNHVGILEAASGGVVFFDEIHTLSLSAQQKLLRALQEKRIRRVGDSSEREIKVDFRLICAAKPDLQRRMAQGQFLLDLYYRINTLAIMLPSLSERKEDIASLILHFAQEAQIKLGIQRSFRAETLACMQEYTWPGQVRELKNAVERLMVDSDGEIIEPSDFDTYLQEVTMIQFSHARNEIVGYKEYIAQAEKEYFEKLISKVKNRDELVGMTGISRATLYRKLSELGLILS